MMKTFLLIVLAICSCLVAQEQIKMWEPALDTYTFPSPTLRGKIPLRGEVQANSKISKVEVLVQDLLNDKKDTYEATVFTKENSAVFTTEVSVKPGKSYITIKAHTTDKPVVLSFTVRTSPTNSEYGSYTDYTNKKVHKDIVRSVAITNNNRYVVSGSDDRTIKILHPKTLETIRTLEGHLRYVRQVKTTPDNKYVISGSDDKSIRIWDIETGKQVGDFWGHKGVVRALAVSHNGKYIASGGDQDQIILWDIQKQQKIRSFEKNLTEYHSMVFSEDDRYLITGDKDTYIYVWNVSDGSMEYDREAHIQKDAERNVVGKRKVTALAIHPSMRFMYSGDETGHVKWWRVLLNQHDDDSKWSGENKLWEMRLALITKNSRDPADYDNVHLDPVRRYPVYFVNKSVSSWYEPYYSKTIRPLSRISDDIVCLEMTGNGEFLLMVGHKGDIRIHDTFTSLKRRTFEYTERFHCGTISYDGSIVAVGASNGKVYTFGIP